jgi:hypothetical protein
MENSKEGIEREMSKIVTIIFIIQALNWRAYILAPQTYHSNPLQFVFSPVDIFRQFHSSFRPSPTNSQ